jgi:hypothetical protein
MRPPMGLLFILHMIHVYGEPQYNDIDSEKLEKLKKNVSQCHFIYHKFHMD